MKEASLAQFAEIVALCQEDDPDFAVHVVGRLISWAGAIAASDLHINPLADGLEVRIRLDGVLHRAGILPGFAQRKVITRFKVLADLLTYRTDIPQEGRIRFPGTGPEIRVSTFPSLYGERVVARFFPGETRFKHLTDLGFPSQIVEVLRRALSETSGAIFVTGPAGSGKTTTMYACLRELAEETIPRNLMTIEDPIEVAIPGVIQSQVDPRVGLDLATALRYLMRQDPEVVAVGEIRDRTTAEVAMEASLTGHLILSTYHAGGAAEAVGRLLDMGIEPYLIRSGVLAVISQRLLRQVCQCAEWTDHPSQKLGMPAERVLVAKGCEQCRHTGYVGRFPIAEFLVLQDEVIARSVLNRSDVVTLERVALERGMVSLWEHGVNAVKEGRTTPLEVRRVLGWGEYWKTTS